MQTYLLSSERMNYSNSSGKTNISQIINIEVRFFKKTLINDQGMKQSLVLLYSVNEDCKNLRQRTGCRYGINVLLIHHH